MFSVNLFIIVIDIYNFVECFFIKFYYTLVIGILCHISNNGFMYLPIYFHALFHKHPGQLCKYYLHSTLFVASSIYFEHYFSQYTPTVYRKRRVAYTISQNFNHILVVSWMHGSNGYDHVFIKLSTLYLRQIVTSLKRKEIVIHTYISIHPFWATTSKKDFSFVKS